jgi:beta-lactamase superfamily II metal-dependent hydrolase
LLDAADEKADVVVFTHPHHDHASGMDRLVNEYTRGVVGCLPYYLHPDGKEPRGANSERKRKEGEVKRALAAIRTYTESNPRQGWPLEAGAQWTGGGVTLRILWPDKADVCSLAQSGNPNVLSAVSWLKWQGLRIQFAADLPLRRYWQTLARRIGDDLRDHHALKIAHHGSLDAQERRVLSAVSDSPRHWALTPWRKGGAHLPRFDDGEGVAELQAHESTVVLTALTAESSIEGSQQSVTREQVLSALVWRNRASGATTPVDRQPDANQAWVAAAFDESGALVDADCGAEALRIRD